jgi:hypothetical protein
LRQPSYPMVVDPPPSVVIEEKEIKVDRGGDVLRTAVHSWKTEIAYTEKTKNHRVINTFQSKSRFRQQRRARASPSIRPAPRPALPSRTLTHARGRGTGNPRFFVPPVCFPRCFLCTASGPVVPKDGMDTERWRWPVVRGRTSPWLPISEWGWTGAGRGEADERGVCFSHRQDTPHHMQPSIRLTLPWDGRLSSCIADRILLPSLPTRSVSGYENGVLL